jgi:competence protein ComEC
VSKRIRLVIGGVIALLIMGIVQIAVADVLEQTFYLPVIINDATNTPTPTSTATSTVTPTPTITPTPTATPHPSGDIRIVEVYNPYPYDPMDEYIVLYNAGSKTVDMTGWYIRDDGDHWYYFPWQFVLKGKHKVWLWTKSGTNSSYELFWGSEEEVWNDTNDCVYLRDDSRGEKVLVDVLCYSNE